MELAVKPGYLGLLEFAARVGLDVEPFQRRILRAVFGPEPEALILVARGAGKTTLMGLVAVHHLLTVEDAKVYVAASSKDQARILFEAAAGFARRVEHPNVVHRMHATLGLPPRVIAEQMGWTLTGVLKLLTVYGHGDVGALEEIDRAFRANVTPLRAVNSDATEMHGGAGAAT